ncbi:repeat-containing protein [Seminavis robusta]|uniref:Repeat-containing protein n=1 Tax=Seminavis robusta TaxID=568900 RepID=A0A9N8E296_9STRA|nr:repeat-containing protein [Seminavis robusta]|eukprot:Sro580_g170180.1 repeat-containing protein (374) ;mRNA; r:45890-47011
MRSSSAFFVLVAMLGHPHSFTTNAFLAKPRQRPSGSTSLFYESQGYNNGGDSFDDVERARKQLEGIFSESDSANKSGTDNNNDNNNDKAIPVKKLIALLTNPANNDKLESMLPPPPPLTSAERDRRMMELKLLEQLASCDDATRELLDLWAAEKGLEALERLEQAEEFLTAGQVIASEQMLLRLIDEFGVYHWVEPLNRLASVYFTQGRFQESYQLCLAVLKFKPWHVGTLEIIVEVAMRLGDRDKAREWATRGLPKLISSTSFPPFAETGPANPQRAVWVHEAIQKAQEALSHLEYQTKRDFFGNPEARYDGEAYGGSRMKQEKTKKNAAEQSNNNKEETESDIIATKTSLMKSFNAAEDDEESEDFGDAWQ